MKLISVTALFIFLLTHVIYSQWIPIDIGTSNTLNCVKFITPSTGWIVGEKGSIFKTTNGGISWIHQTSNTQNNLSYICIFDSLTAYISGYSGEFLKTTNGGTTWVKTLYNPSSSIISMFFGDEKCGWAVGYDGLVMRTCDGALTWSVTQLGNTPLLSVYFRNENIGFITASNGIYYKTTNGGVNWIKYSLANSDWLFDIRFESEQIGLMVGGLTGVSQSIYRTTDGGTNWVKQSTLSNKFLCGVHFYGNNRCIAVGTEGEIILSSNNGQSWQRQSSNFTSQLNSVTNSNDSVLFVVGENGTLLTNRPVPFLKLSNPFGGENFFTNTKTKIKWSYGQIDKIRIEFSSNNRRSWTCIVDSLSTFSEQYVWDIPDVTSDSCFVRITSCDTNQVSLASVNARPFMIREPVSTWFPISQGWTQTSNAVKFADCNYGWIVGSGGKIVATNDAGETWITQNSGTNSNLSSIWTFDSNTVFVSGYQGILLKTSDGGKNWNQTYFGSDVDIVSMFFLNREVGWAVGYYGRVLKTVDGGATWSSQTINSNILTTVYFLDAFTGFTAGADGSFYKTTNGGTSWTKKNITNGSVEWFFGISFSTQRNGVAVGGFAGSSQMIYQTTDKGATWVRRTPVSTNFLCGISFVDALNGWAVGYKGEIIKTLDGGGTWSRQGAVSNAQLNAVGILPNGNAVAAGENGAALIYRSFSTQPWLYLIKPNGGDVFKIGTYQKISWYGELVPFVKTEYSTNGGTSWVLIADSVSGNSGSYNWLVPNSPSNECLLKISSSDNLAISDISQSIFTIALGTGIEELNRPVNYAVKQNFPNPFNPVTTILYQIPVSGNVTIKVFNILGDEITTLVDEYQNPGSYQIKWNGTNYPSGVYFYDIRSGGFQAKKKMLLLK